MRTTEQQLAIRECEQIIRSTNLISYGWPNSKVKGEWETCNQDMGIQLGEFSNGAQDCYYYIYWISRNVVEKMLFNLNSLINLFLKVTSIFFRYFL